MSTNSAAYVAYTGCYLTSVLRARVKGTRARRLALVKKGEASYQHSKHHLSIENITPGFQVGHQDLRSRSSLYLPGNSPSSHRRSLSRQSISDIAANHQQHFIHNVLQHHDQVVVPVYQEIRVCTVPGSKGHRDQYNVQACHEEGGQDIDQLLGGTLGVSYR